jgi:dimethylaniline monooxygenase (N-oxide forming)
MLPFAHDQRNPGPVLLPILGRRPDPAEPGIPIDVSRANLFDTAYVHTSLRNKMIMWDYYHYYIKGLLWTSSGTTAGMDQWIGEISPERHHPSKSKVFAVLQIDLLRSVIVSRLTSC